MIVGDTAECVAAVIASAANHNCGIDCVRWKLRKIPAIAEAIEKLGQPDYRAATQQA